MMRMIETALCVVHRTNESIQILDAVDVKEILTFTPLGVFLQVPYRKIDFLGPS